VDVADVRQTFYNVNNLSNSFTNVAGDKRLQFLKDINYDLCDIWSRLPVLSDFDRKNRDSCQLGNVFRAICYEFTTSTLYLTYLQISQATQF
jgi:hypothetical protein